MADQLRTLHMENSLKKSIYFSIAISLLVTNSISFHKAAKMADCYINDFIYFFEMYQIPWNLGREDGHEEYQKSMDDLVFTMDFNMGG